VDGTNFRRVLLRATPSQYIPCSKKGRKDTPVKNDAPTDEKEQEQKTSKSLLEELIREGTTIQGTPYFFKVSPLRKLVGDWGALLAGKSQSNMRVLQEAVRRKNKMNTAPGDMASIIV
jgi:hypothetical protein